MLSPEVVIGLLLEQPMHAYALKKVVSPRLSPNEEVNDGILYPMLAKLAKEGLIVGSVEKGVNNRPRTVFSVTSEGKQRFLQWLAHESDESDEPTYDFFVGHPFLEKVQFFGCMPKKQRQSKLRHQIELTKAKLAKFDDILSGMRARGVDRFRIDLLKLGIAYQKQLLTWLQSLDT